MNTEKLFKVTEQNTNRVFAIRWILISAMGLAMGLAFGLASSASIEALVGMMLVTPIILGIAGTFFGASQWLAIWKWHRAGFFWIVASAVGLGIGMTLGIVLVEKVGGAIIGEQIRLFAVSPLMRTLSLAVVGAFAGLTIGVAQHLVIRHFQTEINWWILRCLFAFGLGLPIGGVMADLLFGGLQNTAGFVSFLGVTGLIVAFLTVGAARHLVRVGLVQHAT